jgi:hypothetical protein
MMGCQHQVVIVPEVGTVPELHTSLCLLTHQTQLTHQCAHVQLGTIPVVIVGREHIVHLVPTTQYSVMEDITVVNMD